MSNKAAGTHKPEIEIPESHLIKELFEVADPGVEHDFQDSQFCGILISRQ